MIGFLFPFSEGVWSHVYMHVCMGDARVWVRLHVPVKA